MTARDRTGNLGDESFSTQQDGLAIVRSGRPGISNNCRS